MPNFNRVLACALALANAISSAAHGQQQASGYSSERLYLSAPGAGWITADSLDTHGGLGGAMALTFGYSRNPVRATDGTTSLSVVSRQSFLGIGAAVSYDRFRFSLQLDSPSFVRGDSGTIGQTSFTGPSVDWGSAPDVISDTRLGVEVRLVGEAHSAFRFGAGAQLYIPFGSRADYASDGTFRGTVRALVAGDAGLCSYAGHLGIHLRPLNDAATPDAPRGSELLFGVAAGPSVALGGTWKVTGGPELEGASTLSSLFGAGTTAVEGLLSARLEVVRADGLPIRIKLGAGAGLHHRFGAPEWRMVIGVEIFSKAER